MSRIRPCLPITLVVAVAMAIASTSLAARESSQNGADGNEACSEQAEHGINKPVRASTRSPAPPRETRVRPGVQGDTVPGGRLQVPRWHSFLPGMVR